MTGSRSLRAVAQFLFLLMAAVQFTPCTFYNWRFAFFADQSAARGPGARLNF
jgi:hypothetical protein